MRKYRGKSKERIGAAWNNRRGFTLIEMIIVVALIMIITAIVAMNSNFVKGDRLIAASRQLYADLQKVKQNAIMQSTMATSRGFGIRFASNSSYVTFEFNDANNDYIYNNGTSEEKGGIQMTLPSSVTVTIGDAGDPTGNVLIFDKRGILRAPADWSTLSSQIYVLRLAGITQARCVQIDGVTIREGKWNGASCN